MAYDNPDKIIEKRFDWLLSRSQIGLETQITESDFMLHELMKRLSGNRKEFQIITHS